MGRPGGGGGRRRRRGRGPEGNDWRRRRGRLAHQAVALGAGRRRRQEHRVGASGASPRRLDRLAPLHRLLLLLPAAAPPPPAPSAAAQQQGLDTQQGAGWGVDTLAEAQPEKALGQKDCC